MALPQPKVLNLASSITPLAVHLDLQLHHVAAFRSADHSRADIRVVLVERAHVPRVVVMIQNLIRVSHFVLLLNPLSSEINASARVHWTLVRSTPSLCISYSGDNSRSFLTTSTTLSAT